jgi:hypothetical protein
MQTAAHARESRFQCTCLWLLVFPAIDTHSILSHCREQVVLWCIQLRENIFLLVQVRFLRKRSLKAGSYTLTRIITFTITHAQVCQTGAADGNTALPQHRMIMSIFKQTQGSQIMSENDYLMVSGVWEHLICPPCTTPRASCTSRTFCGEHLLCSHHRRLACT